MQREIKKNRLFSNVEILVGFILNMLLNLNYTTGKKLLIIIQ